ncbi:hypothetical protein [Streptomyces sp. NPDC058545]|uniref:hypothetical protein n=1 Tax=Streptomyces sp. NPDC058545 TaxID=3346544 RepID=UPI003660A2C3
MDALFDENAVTAAHTTVLPPPHERLRLRRECRLSVYQVAGACGVSETAIRSWERGTTTPRGHNAEVYHQLLQGLHAYLTKTPLPPSAATLPDWAALGPLHHQIPFQDTETEGDRCWRCRQPTAQRVGGQPQHLGTRCPTPSPRTAHIPPPASLPHPRLTARENEPPLRPPTTRLDYPARGRSTAAGPLAVLEARATSGLTAYLADGTARHCPADTLASLLSWATTAGLGRPPVKNGGLNTGPLLVLTNTATQRLSLPTTSPPPSQRHPHSDHPMLRHLASIGWQTDNQGPSPWTTVHPSNQDPDADGMHLAVTPWGALDDWSLPAHLDAAQLARFLGTYTDLLRTPIGSPGACGHKLMSDLRPPPHLHATTGKLLSQGAPGALTRVVDPAPCEAPEGHRLAHGRSPADKVIVEDYDWWRPPTDAEATLTHVTCLAVNLLHVADVNNIRVAYSSAELVDHPTFDRKIPGSWLVDLTGSGRHHRHLPASYPGTGLAWHPTPAVACAQSRGISTAPIKAYLRPGQTRPYLEPWYQRIRLAHFAALERLGITADMPPDDLCHAIQQLGSKDDTDLALLRAVHTSAIQGIDLLTQPPSTHNHLPGQTYDTPNDPTWRPDLHASIIANARARLRRKLGTTAYTGRFPLAVYQDHILYATHAPSVREITDDPDSGFRLGLSPGHVRPVTTHSMDWYLHHYARDVNPAQLLKNSSPW